MSPTAVAHDDEITRLRAHARADYLSPLEAKAVLTAIELLEGHVRGQVRLCELPHAQSLVSLCLGSPFEAGTDGVACGCHGRSD